MAAVGVRELLGLGGGIKHRLFWSSINDIDPDLVSQSPRFNKQPSLMIALIKARGQSQQAPGWPRHLYKVPSTWNTVPFPLRVSGLLTFHSGNLSRPP